MATVLLEEIDKPELDNRSYRLIQLSNDLQALLVHDPDTDKASAALDVHIGHLSDPWDAAGLAHFCEHLLFMGTEKYPRENDYSEYLSAHSGHSNAYTSTVDTNYFFEVGHEFLEPALDRFSQFFISPLFLESCKDRELLAVDSENKKNLQNDMWRAYQLEKSLSNPKHVYSKFGTGNLETLKEIPASLGHDVRDELLKFHGELYSANLMRLVILGRDSLDALQQLAVDKFSSINNKGIQAPVFDGNILRPQQELGKIYTFKPIKEVRNLELCFPIPECDNFWRSQPSHYLSHLLGHEGEGSVLSLLKQKGWALVLGAGGSNAAPGTDFFKITMELTADGVKHWRDIVKIVFAYIELIKKDGLQKWMWDENRLLSEAQFRYREKSPASRFTADTAGKLHRPIDKRFILGTSVPREFKVDEIKQCLDCLRPDNFRVAMADPDVQPNLTEKYYGTQYRLDDLDASLLEACRSAGESPIAELALPAKNEFVPERFDTGKHDVDRKSKHPDLLKDTPSMRLWHKKDDTFWVPKANYLYRVTIPALRQSAKDAVMGKLFIELLKDSLNEFSYNADIAGLQYSIEPTVGGLNLGFSGYNDKMPVLAEKVIRRMRNLEVSEQRFIIEKERLQRDLGNFELEAPYQQVSYHMSFVLAHVAHSKQEQLAALSSVSFKDLETLSQHALDASHVEILAHGNVSSDEALAAAALYEEVVQAKPLPEEQVLPLRALWIPQGKRQYQLILKDEENANSAIEYFCQVGYISTTSERALGMLLAQIANEPAFDQLRTKEQLGYIVFSGSRTTLTSNGFRIIIQSEKSAVYLESRIEAFLDVLKAHLEKLSTEEFEKQRKSVIDRKNEQLRNLNQETKLYFHHIQSGNYEFDEVDVSTRALKQITQQQLLAFFMQYVHPSSSTRRQISVHLQSQKAMAESEERLAAAVCNAIADAGESGEATVIASGNIQSFKDGCEVMDFPRPVRPLQEYAAKTDAKL
ncbi:Metalloenzyme, LuxS/M16 peptidase-like protein [Protomyces lactucae-debilis]|uniref:Metalloenzyme, LuxS/M16 peptidase-like protein n=1 Tax=Protomyces lactucae-debilis TaxID=2754530 RepID=A0A1Y2FGV7_PROLT|nr:Metalloenzyme, LuxS/M16 peptidase-like protein [Protomyces lactucae-debilis]ORY83170.1 Metalloenzyme, LuxS/M16 peptidase-like protein [Protomyces lactucae-debilis]